MYFVIYVDNKLEWRWMYRSANHETIAVSSEGYARRESCMHSINLVKAGAATAKVFDDQRKTWQ